MSESSFARSGSPPTVEDSVEEQEWIARIRHGDPLAFKALYDSYSDAMFAFAFASLGSREEAQDVVHDIFFNILKNRGTWNVDRGLRSYLMRCVYNRVATLRRHFRVELASHESIAREADSPLEWAYRGSTDDPLLQGELADALARAIDSLPPRSQQAYRLVREQALSYAAAASVMGISTHTVEVHLIRALKALRDHLASWRR
jgi:RNA polymerase sigma-19 factor, ECF subfamily